MMRYSVARKKDQTIHVVCSYWATTLVYPASVENEELLLRYIRDEAQNLDYHQSENPLFIDVFNFDGYFHAGDWAVPGYLHFTRGLTTGEMKKIQSERHREQEISLVNEIKKPEYRALRRKIAEMATLRQDASYSVWGVIGKYSSKLREDLDRLMTAIGLGDLSWSGLAFSRLIDACCIEIALIVLHERNENT